MAIVDKKIEIKKSGSAMTSAVSQLVYMPNFRAIGQSVWEKNGNRQTETQKDRQKHKQTHLNFIYLLAESTHIHGYKEKATDKC